MSTDLVQRPTTVLSNEQLTYISRTEFVPAGLRGNLPAILACVATGRALGIDDMTAIRSIHVIDGKATFSAELMVMLVRRAGHSISGETGEGETTVVGKRADNGDTMKVTWTLAMAERAGLLKKSNWRQYPESMLWARAVSQLCRMLFPDCFAGQTYTAEELGDEALTEPVPASAAEPAVTSGNPEMRLDTGPPAADSMGEPMEASSQPHGAVFTQAEAPQPEQASPVEDDGKFPPLDSPLPGSDPVVTEKQAGLIRVRADKAGLTDYQRHAITQEITGQPSSKLVRQQLMDYLLASFETPGLARLLALADVYASLVPEFDTGTVVRLSLGKDEAWVMRQTAALDANIASAREALTASPFKVPTPHEERAV